MTGNIMKSFLRQSIVIAIIGCVATYYTSCQAADAQNGSSATNDLLDEMLDMQDLNHPKDTGTAVEKVNEQGTPGQPEAEDSIPAEPALMEPPTTSAPTEKKSEEQGDLIEQMLNLPNLETNRTKPTPPSEPETMPAAEPITTEPIDQEAEKIQKPAESPSPVSQPAKEDNRTAAEKAAETEGTSAEDQNVATPQKKDTKKQETSYFPGRADDIFWSGSLMYSPNDYKKLRDAIIIYQRLVRRGTPNGFLTGVSAIERRVPTFFLNSIVFLSKDNWTFWLNNKKYTMGKQTEIFQVINVARDNVQLLWKPEQSINQWAPNWQNNLTITSGGDYVSDNGAIWVNGTGDEIHFTLHPNQTFDPQEMHIIEGLPKETGLSGLIPAHKNRTP